MDKSVWIVVQIHNGGLAEVYGPFDTHAQAEEEKERRYQLAEETDEEGSAFQARPLLSPLKRD